MSPAIRVENLSKQYRLGARGRDHYHTLRESLTSAFTNPMRRFRPDPTRQPAANTFWALRDVSFNVQPGEVVGIIGRNGAGKSTLLKILSRIVEPTSGRAEIRGRMGSLLEVGTGFHPELTGRENIYLNGAILGMKQKEIDRKFDEIVAFSELEKFLDTPVKRYSSGMYVRLAFAVAAHLDPDILTVDEVLAVGDSVFQKRCVGKMAEFAGSGQTVVFVSHHLDLIRRLCSHTILLEEGRIKAQGTTSDILALYERDSPLLLSAGNTYDLDKTPHDISHDVKFSSVRISRVDAAECGPIESDGAMAVDMVVDSSRELSVNSFAVTLYDSSRVKILNADILSLGKRLTFRAGRNHVRYSFESLALKPGRYVLGLWVANYPTFVFAHVSYAGEIEVVHAPGQISPPSDGYVTCRFNAEIANDPSQ